MFGRPQRGGAIECRVLVRVAVSRCIHRHVGDGVHGAAATNDHLANTDDLGGDIADAMNPHQLPVGLQKDQLQEPAPPGDRPARRKTEVSTTDFIVQAFPGTAPRSGPRRDFRHAVDRGDGARIDGPLERDPKPWQTAARPCSIAIDARVGPERRLLRRRIDGGSEVLSTTDPPAESRFTPAVSSPRPSVFATRPAAKSTVSGKAFSRR